MKQFIKEAQRLQKLAGITEAKVVPSSYNYSKLFADFSADNPKTDIINRFARTIAELLRITSEYRNPNENNEFTNIHIGEVFGYGGMDDIEDGDNFYTGPNESLKTFQSLPKTFTVNNNMDDPTESWKITKIGPSSFNAERIFNTNEAKIVPQNLVGGLTRNQLLDDIVAFDSEHPRFIQLMGFNSKEEVRDYYNKLETSELIELIASDQTMYPILKDFYKKHKKIIIDSKDYTDFYLQTVEMYIKRRGTIQEDPNLLNTNEAKVVPQRMPRRLKGQISEEEWKAIGPNFTTDEIVINYDTDASDTIFETPQGFRFNMAPYPIRNGEVLVYELQYNDYDPDPGIEEWVDDQVNELKQQLKNAGYNLEVAPFNGGMMLYIPV